MKQNKTKNKNELFDFSEALIKLEGNRSEGVKVIQGLNITGKLDFYQRMRYRNLIKDFKISETLEVKKQMKKLEKELENSLQESDLISAKSNSLYLNLL